MAGKIKLQLTPKQMQIAAAAVVLLGAFGYVYFRYFWKPVSERIAAAQASIDETQAKIDKARAQAARLPQIQRELVILNQQAADAEKRLPKNKDLPAVIDTVASIARKHKVNLVNFTPGSLSSKAFFSEVPYTMAINGSFHDIGRFFAAIAMEERIFSVKNVSFSGGGGADGKLNVAFTLVSYQYKG